MPKLRTARAIDDRHEWHLIKAGFVDFEVLRASGSNGYAAAFHADAAGELGVS